MILRGQMSFLRTKQIQSWILKSGSYLGAPQLDGPVEGGANKQVGEVQRPRSCVAADPCDGPVVALKHLANACFAVGGAQMKLWGLVRNVPTDSIQPDKFNLPKAADVE